MPEKYTNMYLLHIYPGYKCNTSRDYIIKAIKKLVQDDLKLFYWNMESFFFSSCCKPFLDNKKI